jgi:hypothetical protein
MRTWALWCLKIPGYERDNYRGRIMRLQGAPALTAHIGGKSWQGRTVVAHGPRQSAWQLPTTVAFRIFARRRPRTHAHRHAPLAQLGD